MSGTYIKLNLTNNWGQVKGGAYLDSIAVVHENKKEKDKTTLWFSGVDSYMAVINKPLEEVEKMLADAHLQRRRELDWRDISGEAPNRQKHLNRAWHPASDAKDQIKTKERIMSRTYIKANVTYRWGDAAERNGVFFDAVDSVRPWNENRTQLVLNKGWIMINKPFAEVEEMIAKVNIQQPATLDWTAISGDLPKPAKTAKHHFRLRR